MSCLGLGKSVAEFATSSSSTTLQLVGRAIDGVCMCQSLDSSSSGLIDHFYAICKSLFPLILRDFLLIAPVNYLNADAIVTNEGKRKRASVYLVARLFWERWVEYGRGGEQDMYPSN